MHSSLLAKRKTHQGKLETERKRLKIIDDAIREAREEKKREAEAAAAIRRRVEEEQARMDEWEQYQPPPPPPPEEVVVTGVNEEDAEVLLDDGSALPMVDPEQLEALKELLAQDLSAAEPEGQKVLADIFEKEEIGEAEG